MNLTINVEVLGYSSYVDDVTLRDHLKEIAEDIKGHAEFCSFQGYYRKVNIDYDKQEDVNLEILTKIEEST